MSRTIETKCRHMTKVALGGVHARRGRRSEGGRETRRKAVNENLANRAPL